MSRTIRSTDATTRPYSRRNASATRDCTPPSDICPRSFDPTDRHDTRRPQAAGDLTRRSHLPDRPHLDEATLAERDLLRPLAGLPGEAPGYQVLGDLADLPPRPLYADVGRELPLRDQIGEPAEAHRRRLDPELREKVEAVQRRAPVDEELPRIERDLGGGGDTERDAHGATLEGGQCGAEGPSAHGLDDEVVLGRGRNRVAHHDLVGTELAQRRPLVGASGARCHVRAGEPRELHRKVADTTGGAR